MDLRTLTKLMLKLAGLYLLVTVLTSIPTMLATPAQYISIAAVSLGLYTVAGLALVLFPGVIVSRIIRIKGYESGGAVTATAVLRVGVMLLGCYFAISSTYSVAFVWAKTQWFYVGTHAESLLPDDKASLFSSGVQFVLGLLLWCAGGFIVRLTERLQSAR